MKDYVKALGIEAPRSRPSGNRVYEIVATNARAGFKNTEQKITKGVEQFIKADR